VGLGVQEHDADGGAVGEEHGLGVTANEVFWGNSTGNDPKLSTVIDFMEQK